MISKNKIKNELQETNKKICALKDRQKKVKISITALENKTEILSRCLTALRQSISVLEGFCVFGELDDMISKLKGRVRAIEQELKEEKKEVENMITAKEQVDMDFEKYREQLSKLGFTEQQIIEAEQEDILEVVS